MNSVLRRIVADVLRDERGLPPETPVIRKAPAKILQLMDSGFFLIAEIKHRSPSKGLLRKQFNPEELASAYSVGGASAISVVTEKNHFGGLPEHLTSVRKAVGLPLLRKDFIMTHRQVTESFNLGADMILLIAACLEASLLTELHSAATELGMTPIIEVHRQSELEKALAADPMIIGINNRDLNDFRVDINTSLNLIGEIPSGIRAISESGISTGEQIRQLKAAGFSGALVGETLLVSNDPVLTLRGLLHE